MIDNPDYDGKWAPRKIPNPEYFEDATPHKMTPIGAIGLELWTLSDDIYFDNIYIGNDAEAARALVEQVRTKGKKVLFILPLDLGFAKEAEQQCSHTLR